MKRWFCHSEKAHFSFVCWDDESMMQTSYMPCGTVVQAHCPNWNYKTLAHLLETGSWLELAGKPDLTEWENYR